MRIFTIDAPCPPSPLVIAHTDYFSRASLGQYDAVLWNPQALHARLVRDNMELSVMTSADVFAATRHWREEFKALWHRGGTVVAFLPANAMVLAHHFEDLIDLNLLDALGSDLPRPVCIERSSGPLQTGGQPFHDFFVNTRDAWAPVSMLEHKSGTTVLRSADGMILASYHTRHAGRLLLLPQLASGISPPFLQAISVLIARLTEPSLIINAGWLTSVPRPAQFARDEAISACRREIQALQQKIDVLETITRQSVFEAQLVAGTGRGVYRAVYAAVAQMNPAAEQDWLDESMVIVPGHEGAFVFKTLLFGEDLDDRTLTGIAADIARVEWERGAIQRVVMVDCRSNTVPLDQRTPRSTDGEDDEIMPRGWMRVTGADLFVVGAEPCDNFIRRCESLSDVPRRADERLRAS